MEVFFSNTKVIERLARIEKRLETLEAQGKKIAPEASMRLRAFTLTPMHEVKVLILGQDPYHGKNQADGLCFSVKKNIPLPPSLKNIFKEMCEDLGCNMPQNGDLTSWAKQGVILLNTILTVEEGCPLSHKDLGWQEIVYTYLE